MRDSDFNCKIEALQQRVYELKKRTAEGPAQLKEITPEAFEELRISLEELLAADEELATARQAVETEHERYQELFEFANLVEQTNDWVWEIDKNGVFTYVNPNVREIMGYKPEEILGKTTFDFMSSDEAKRFAEVIGSFISVQKPFKNLEKTLIHKDGYLVVLETSGSPVFDSQGVLQGYRGIARDITERKRAEEALRESEEKYRNLFENIPTGIYRTTPDGRILMANPALIRMLEYSSFDELASRNLEEEGFQPTYQRSQFKELVEREGEVRGLESAWIRCDSTMIFVRENARAIRGKDGTVLYYEGTVEDITEHKRVEEVLKENFAKLSKKNRYETIISTVTRAVHQSIDLQDVLENAVEAMSKNIEGVENVFISLVEGEEAVLKTHRGYPDWFIERVRRIPYPKGATWKTIIEGRPRYCPDVDQDTVIGPAGREVGTKSYLSMPIGLGGKTVGVININSFQKNAFDEEELKLLEIVAQQIEVAINNAQQAEALRQSEEALRESLAQLSKKNRYETIIGTVTRSVHQSINLEDVLENAVDAMSKNIDEADSASIYLIEGEEAVLKAHRGYPDWFIERAGRIPYPKGATWKTIIEGKPIYCADVDQDTVIGPAGREMGIKSYLSMPICFEGKAVGTLNITSFEKSAFSEEELKLMEIVTKQIEMAINNAQQAELLRRINEELELRVQERTQKLSETNEELKKEVAERKRAEIALQRFKFISDNSNDAHHFLNREGRFLYVNKVACERLGFSEEEMLRMSVPDIDPFYTKAKVQEVFERLQKERVLPFESIHKRKDGSTFPVEISVIGVTFEEEPYIFAVIRDITERKRAEEELRKRTEQIIRHQAALLELAKMDNSDLNSALRKITEVDSKMLGVERASVWLFNKDRSEIICKNLYKMSENSHENGSKLQIKQYPVYFRSLEESRIIAANDARTDPRTSEYAEGYLRPYGITSMMDVPVRVHGKVVGIVCHEHTGPMREWTVEEQDFAASIADMVSLALEASEHKKAEEQIKSSLKEKEVLLKEVHHRVKNNLQVISSLLRLQSEYIREKETIEMLNETENRVQSMALIHEILYQSRDLSRINFVEYIQNLGVYLFQSYGVKSHDIKLKINVDNISLGVDTAITCGLIINELVSNSLKHAFPRQKKGEIRIALSSDNGGGDLSSRPYFTLIVSDNGVGFPKDLDFRNTESLGLQLVITLVKKLKGAIELDRSNGTAFKITFSSLPAAHSLS